MGGPDNPLETMVKLGADTFAESRLVYEIVTGIVHSFRLVLERIAPK